MKYYWTLDKGVLLAVLFLMGLGLVQVYSSSFIFATESYGDGLYFFKKQLTFAFLALGVLLTVAWLPPRWSMVVAYMALVGALIGLVLTFVPEFSIRAGGASRWVRLPLGQRFEPSELLKVTFPLLMAVLITKQWNRWPLALKALSVILVFAPLMMLQQQPDFGSLVICVAVALGLLFAFGLAWRYIFGATLVSAGAFYLLVMHQPYRLSRIKAFLDPWADPSESGFQVIQSMLSFHSGGLWGSGLGEGQGKLFFLPEAHTDFTLAVFGEEMGFVGFFVLFLIYGFLIFRGMQIVLNTERDLKRAFALGLVMTFAFSLFINVGVVLGVLPTKGLTLPFLSYGGSSLVSLALAFGWLLNIQREQELIKLNRHRIRHIPLN